MKIEERLLKFVTWSNWVLLFCFSVAGFLYSPHFAGGVLSGGLIVTINFHLLYRTLKKALAPPHVTSYHAVLAKYYVRFAISGVIIFFLICKNVVNPVGLFIGLSIVVASIILATMLEIKNLILKEAM